MRRPHPQQRMRRRISRLLPLRGVPMESRTFLVGSATAVAGLATLPAASQSPPAAGQPLARSDLQSTVARLRKQFLSEFDPAYVENVIVPHFLVSTYEGER